MMQVYSQLFQTWPFLSGIALWESVHSYISYSVCLAADKRLVSSYITQSLWVCSYSQKVLTTFVLLTGWLFVVLHKALVPQLEHHQDHLEGLPDMNAEPSSLIQ